MNDPAKPEIIALVSCVKKKRSGPCPARDLYISSLFRLSRAYAEQHADQWLILSAKYGLVAPDTVLERYEQTLKDAPKQERRAWPDRVYKQMRESGLLHPGASFLWLAGQDYQRNLSRMLGDFPQHDPLVGKRYGERLSWLKAQVG